MNEIPKHYNPNQVEDKWYSHWEAEQYFQSEPNEREAYTVVMPPPNVTGILHMGHMLNNTIQDILIRKARMDGKNACWVPGTDHASIATEAKVVKMLREKGIKKSDISREEFLEYAWNWKHKYGGKILNQLRKLGASCDWSRTAFTMDEKRSQHVLKAFIDLYERGKLYRDYRMVNWDSKAQTVLSNEEVIYSEEKDKLFTVKYRIEGSDEYIKIATTRPETIMGDTAIAVHPEDERYKHLNGKNAVVPMAERVVPIIFDEYVEMDFGTGALKVTPAHDVNDYEIGKRHDLETIDVLNDDGTINAHGGKFQGLTKFKAREASVKELEKIGALEKIEDLIHNVGRSERTNSVVEPKLSLQWYVKMDELVKPALDVVMEKLIRFRPEKYINTYRHWMENMRDWCISRQLWWGQRIPVYYYDVAGVEKMVVAIDLNEALLKAQKENGSEFKLSDLRQDEDVLDTWFSSWLWPISVFDGFYAEEEVDYYYPTAVLVTGWDILFLWVARMVVAGLEWKKEIPFKDVYFTGMVRDKKRRKMSKSLGNSPDALELISDYGADAVRFGMMSCSPAGGDLLFDEKLIENGRNFCNKMWNALRLIQGWEVDDLMEQTPSDRLAAKWFNSLMAIKLDEINGQFDAMRLSETLKSLYSFIWGDFCSWYLEMIKPEGKIAADTKEDAVSIMEMLMKMLHPFMPFITEEIWHSLRPDRDTDLIVSFWPSELEGNDELVLKIKALNELVSKIRELRSKYQLKRKEMLNVYYEKDNELRKEFEQEEFTTLFKKLAFVEDSGLVQNPDEFVCIQSGTSKYYIPLAIEQDVDLESKKIKEEIARLEKFEAGIEKKLANEKFVSNAPQSVVEMERKKLSDAKTKIANHKTLLESLNK